MRVIAQKGHRLSTEYSIPLLNISSLAGYTLAPRVGMKTAGGGELKYPYGVVVLCKRVTQFVICKGPREFFVVGKEIGHLGVGRAWDVMYRQLCAANPTLPFQQYQQQQQQQQQQQYKQQQQLLVLLQNDKKKRKNVDTDQTNQFISGAEALEQMVSNYEQQFPHSTVVIPTVGRGGGGKRPFPVTFRHGTTCSLAYNDLLTGFTNAIKSPENQKSNSLQHLAASFQKNAIGELVAATNTFLTYLSQTHPEVGVLVSTLIHLLLLCFTTNKTLTPAPFL
jgi:tRNA A37 threonylcarbamoyltransferase TsaD